MTQPLLLFCVGATKAGTTWLYDYLRGHPDCHLRSVKELHYWDSIDQGTGWQRRALQAKADAMAARLAAGQPGLAQGVADRRELLALMVRPEDPRAYLDFLDAGRAGQRVVADITPAYGLLSADRLRKMAALLPDVRFLYLMRDPVERLWSHVRMMAVRRAEAPSEVEERAGRILRRTLRGEEPEIMSRSDYRGAVARLDESVAPDRLLLMFHEDLMGAGGLRRLAEFLGIRPHPGDGARRVHEGVQVAMTAGQRRAAAEWLAPQYEFVNRRMGGLPAAWMAAERV